jgi:hypothetical protein
MCEGEYVMDRTESYRKMLRQIDDLSDEELADLLSYLREIITTREHMAKYDPAKDSILTGEGLFKGPPDLSERVEEILYGEDTPTKEGQ